MPPISIPDREAAMASWNQVYLYSDRLFDALERLQENGGSPRVAVVAGWSDKSQEKALATMRATHQALGEEIARLEARRSHYPARRRRIG